MPPLSRYQKIVRFLLIIGGVFVVLAFLWRSFWATICFFGTCPMFQTEKMLIAFIPLISLAFAVWLYSRRKNYHLALLFLVLSLVLVWYGGKISNKFHGIEIRERLPGISEVEVRYYEQDRKDISLENTGFVVYSPTFLPDGFVKKEPVFWRSFMGSPAHVKQSISFNASSTPVSPDEQSYTYINIDSGATSSYPYKYFNSCATGETQCSSFTDPVTGEVRYSTFERGWGISDTYYTKRGDTYILVSVVSTEAINALRPYYMDFFNSFVPINLGE